MLNTQKTVPRWLPEDPTDLDKRRRKKDVELCAKNNKRKKKRKMLTGVQK